MRWLRKCINCISNWTVITIRWTFKWRRCICFYRSLHRVSGRPCTVLLCTNTKQLESNDKITINWSHRTQTSFMFILQLFHYVFGIAFAVLIFAVFFFFCNRTCTLITTTRCSVVLYRRAFEVDARVFFMSRLWCCRMHIHSSFQSLGCLGASNSEILSPFADCFAFKYSNDWLTSWGSRDGEMDAMQR